MRGVRKANISQTMGAFLPNRKAVFHKVVERPVDNHVDKPVKSALLRLLDRIA